MLLQGNGLEDMLFLQLKQSRRSCVAPFVHGDMAWHAHQGQRVVEYQQTLQTVSDPLLGWTTVDKRDYYVRQFRDMKGAVTVEGMDGSALMDYGRICGTPSSPRVTRDPPILPPSPVIWAKVMPPTVPSPNLPARMQTRPKRTTKRSNRPSRRGGFRWRPASRASTRDKLVNWKQLAIICALLLVPWSVVIALDGDTRWACRFGLALVFAFTALDTS